MLGLITVAQTLIYSAFFVCERVFLFAEKKSSARFADVRRIATGQVNYICSSLLFGCPHSSRQDIYEAYMLKFLSKLCC